MLPLHYDRGCDWRLIAIDRLPSVKLETGVEPATRSLQESRSAKLSYTSILVAELGVEPSK
jgi:hypothetical protein